MLKIRLQRVGRKHEPAFRLVLTDSKNSTKSGRFKEILGSYDARKSTDLLKTDRISHWLSQGALATGTVHNLLVKHKVIDAKKVNVLPKKTFVAKAPEPVVEEAARVEEAPVEASEAPAEAPEVTPEPVETAPEAPASESTEEVVQ
jgi:small subunit ribosomal protein S16